jgi:membrane protein DedA with SNARE-associated domain
VAVHDEELTTREQKPVIGLRYRIVGASFVLMMGGRIVGAALSPMFLAHAPLALLVLSPVIGHLVIVAALSEPIAYYSISLTISIIHCMLGFLLGRMQGPWVIQFLVRRGIATESRLQRLLAPLRVSAPLLVFAIPGPIVCALAGASAVSRRAFLPALVGSQVAWVILCRLSGQAMLGWIATMRAGIVRHAIPLTLATTLIVVFIHFRRSRRDKAP